MSITKAGIRRTLSVLLPLFILVAAGVVLRYAETVEHREAKVAVASVTEAAPQGIAAPEAEAVQPEPARRGFFTLHPTDLKALSKIVKNVWSGFDDETSVPGFAPLSIPKGISDLPAKKRKELFILSVLPHVVAANEKIAQRREGLLSLLEKLGKGLAPDAAEKSFLLESAECYDLASSAGRLIEKDPQKLVKSLLHRVDIVPPSLAVAQAASESAWGGSRFANEGNNLFGQWSFSPTKGIVPARSDLDKKYGLARYPTIAQSVDSYIKNLNTFSAYGDFRQIRSELREKGEKLDSQRLAQGLLRYSTRGAEYVEDIRLIIRQNNLARYDDSVIVPIGEESLVGHFGKIEENLYNL